MSSASSFISSAVCEETFSSSWDGSTQSYLLKDYRHSERCPLLLVYLHGANNHQNQGMTAAIYNNAFGRLGSFLQAQGAVYVCPEYRGNSWMGPAAEQDVQDILRLMKKRFTPEKTLLVGGSMGGTSALIYAMRHSNELDGVLAFCPASDPVEIFEQHEQFRAGFITSYGGSPSENLAEYRLRTSRNFAAALAALPIVIVHGTADAVIPVHHSIQLAKALEQNGARLLYVELPGGHHDSPIEPPFDEYFRFLGFDTNP